jgi:hypothetical protein
MQNNVIFLLLITIVVSTSCSLEEKAALKSQKEIAQTTVLISADPELYKTNAKYNIPENISDDEYEKLYASSMDSSDFIGEVDVDAYWNQCKNEIENNITKSSLRYLPSDSITEFIDNDKPKFIFDIKQVELDEYSVDFVETYSSTYEEYGYFNENYAENMDAIDFSAIIDNYEIEIPKKYYNEDGPPTELNIPGDNIYSSITKKQSDIQIIKPINAASINIWVEVNSYLKNEGHKRELIFISRSMEDVVTNDLSLKYDDLLNIQSWYKFSNLGYKIDSINLDKMWLNSEKWSKEITDILNSYVINKIIEDFIHNASDNKYRKRFWILNTKTGRILPTDNTPEYEIIEKFEND